jgi:hypothetical protein
MAEKTVTVTLPRTEALALAIVAEKGIAVVEALGLIQDTGPASRALKALREATDERSR